METAPLVIDGCAPDSLNGEHLCFITGPVTLTYELPDFQVQHADGTVAIPTITQLGTVQPDINLVKKFGSVDLKDQIQKIVDEADALKAGKKPAFLEATKCVKLDAWSPSASATNPRM